MFAVTWLAGRNEGRVSGEREMKLFSTLLPLFHLHYHSRTTDTFCLSACLLIYLSVYLFVCLCVFWFLILHVGLSLSLPLSFSSSLPLLLLHYSHTRLLTQRRLGTNWVKEWRSGQSMPDFKTTNYDMQSESKHFHSKSSIIYYSYYSLISILHHSLPLPLTL